MGSLKCLKDIPTDSYKNGEELQSLAGVDDWAAICVTCYQTACYDCVKNNFGCCNDASEAPQKEAEVEVVTHGDEEKATFLDAESNCEDEAFPTYRDVDAESGV